MFKHTYLNFVVFLKLDDGFLAVGLVELLSFVHQRLLFNNIYYYQAI
jgi:hypothetical protein